MALSYRSLLTLAISSSLFLTAGSALAKKGGGGGGGGGGKNTQQRAQPTPVNPAIAQDQQAISSARSDLAKAQSALDTATSKATSDFEATPDLIAAKKAVTDAQAALDAARDTVMAKLASDPTYKTATDAENAAQKKLDDLKATDGTTQDQIADQATEILKLGGVTSKIERDALDADQTYQDAQTKLTTATKALADLRAKFKAGLKTDPTIGPLFATRDDDQQKVNAAIAKLSSDSSSASAY